MLALPLDEPPVIPVTSTCIVKAVQTYQVPAALLMGVMAQEGGKTGKATRNSNGTQDHGPMQINTAWTKQLTTKGIAPESVKNNGCLNVLIGAAILKKHANEANGNWWHAVGNYHSKTPYERDKYMYKVAAKVQMILSGKLTVADIIQNTTAP